jgi:nucleotide-binding universal stress UspA family protein
MDYVSPFDDRARTRRALAPRAGGDLDGRRVVLLDISKARGDEFLERMGELLEARGAVVTRRLAKPTFTRPAPVELIEEAAEHADLVVEGLAD